jgi:hypothetical protein
MKEKMTKFLVRRLAIRHKNGRRSMEGISSSSLFM